MKNSFIKSVFVFIFLMLSSLSFATNLENYSVINSSEIIAYIPAEVGDENKDLKDEKKIKRVETRSSWKPFVYEFLNPQEKQIIDSLNYTSALTKNFALQLFSQLKFSNCHANSFIQNGELHIHIDDLQNQKTYRLFFPDLKSKMNFLTDQKTQASLFFAVTDSRDIQGLGIEGMTHSVSVELDSQTGLPVSLHLNTSSKTILSNFREFFGQDILVKSDLICR